MFVVVHVKGSDVPNPTMVGISPSKELKVLGPFDTEEHASHWIRESLEPIYGSEEIFAILPLEWYAESI